MSDYETVLASTSGPVSVVSLNRPDALNAFDANLRRDLAAALTAAHADPETRVIVLSAEGRAFCAGADLKAAKPGRDTQASLMNEYKPVMDAITKGPKPVVVAAQGACAGIGASLVMAADLAVMEEDAYLYLAFAAIGLIPDGGAHWMLLRAIGKKRAYQMIVEAGRLTAPEALEAGLANKVAPKGEGVATAMEWAAKLAQGAPRTLRYAKSVLAAANDHSFDDSYAYEAALQGICSGSEDNANAVKAFLAKQKPVFTGA
ncbi:enoyl-CoA hydratase-related protein [Albimonas sp. CAU 1670]|uniref:enoyl-CoA hydratase/isomerase family protein n=1 Tax=Albimonas sp. CAU 1670 TaxID=3032599 RepID=UPI0023DB8EB9|nr:enoyl-CoA hydratase-related protein [Albimonas sp. CAU 1670]MDF2233488.1 enoyl-CoA hydratase-related protein [Albimonas sp. CAU 1670]